MSILYRFTPDGFTCGDTETGRTCHAYTSSTYATQAKRNPAGVAREMLEAENAFQPSAAMLERIRERDTVVMHKLANDSTTVLVETMPDLTYAITEFRIEAIVEYQTNCLDRAYVGRGTMTTLEYERAMRALNVWADRQYARCSKGA